MTNYYVPLSAIFGTSSIEGLLARIPLVGNMLSGALEEAAREIGIRNWRETWNGHDVTVRGSAVWGHGDLTLDCRAFTLGIGRPVGDTAEFDFEMSSDRSSLATAAAELGEELLGVGDLDSAGGKAKVLFRADAPVGNFRLLLRGLNLRVRFSRKHLRKGTVVNGPDGQPYRIVPLESGSDDTAEIVLAPGVLIIDSLRGVSFEFEDDQLVEVPPLLVVSDDGKPYFGVLVHKLKFDLSVERDLLNLDQSLPEVLAAGYDESWRGIYFEELSVFNMDQLFFPLPKSADPRVSTDRRTIEAKNWFIDADGVSGYLRIAFLQDEPSLLNDDPQNPANRLFQGLSFELDVERHRLVMAGGEVTLHAGTFHSDLASLGPDGNLVIGFSLRDTPSGGSELEAVLRVAEPRDPKSKSLLSFENAFAQTIVMALALVLGLPATDPLNTSMARTFAVALAELFLLLDWIKFQYIGVDAIRMRRRTELLVKGDLIWFDFSFDFRLKLAFDTPDLPLVGKIKTKPDHPITALVHGFRYSFAQNFGDFDPGDLGERKPRGIGFDSNIDKNQTPGTAAGPGIGKPANAISFEVGEDTIIDQAPLAIVKLGAGQWDLGLWIELGVKAIDENKDFSYSVMPSLIRIYLNNDGGIDHVEVKGASFSVLVPQVLFAKGEWSTGEVSKVTGRALLLSKGDKLDDYKDPSKWSYNVGFGMREQDLPPPPAPKQATSRILAFEFESSSGVPLFGTTSLYGVSGLYASNARPALGSDTPTVWLTQRAPAYQVGIDKWEAALDSSGLALGVVLGATTEKGKLWNLKAGFIASTPGPVLMLYGTMNIMKQRLSVKDTNPAAVTFYATLDFVRSEFLLGARLDYKKPDATGRELKLTIPAELFFTDHSFHFYLGQDKPAERMVSAELLGKFKIAGYLMLDTETIANVGETGVDVPGFAVALGARYSFEAGWKGSHYKLYLYAKAAFDGAAHFTDPTLILVRLMIAGGLVAKAYGLGFEFEVSAEFKKVWSTPDLQVGQLKVTLDLPWPIPNLSLKIDCSSGEDGDGAPLAGSLLDGLTLFLRASNTNVEFAGEVADVPLDPIFSLAFKYPTRNESSVAGSFNVAGGSASTYHFIAGDSAAPRGYAVTLELLTLYKNVAGVPQVVAGPIPAMWRPQPVKAAGGQADTSILELFAYQGIEASRFIGASADYVDWATEGFDQCPPPGPPDPICYLFDSLPVGPAPSTLSVANPTFGPLTVSLVAGGAFTESVRRFHGLTEIAAEIVASPVPGLAAHMLRLPSSNGHTPPIHTGESARLEFARAEEATLLVLRYPGGTVHTRGYLRNGQVAADDTGQILSVFGEDRFEIVQYTLKGPLDQIDIEVAHGPGPRLRQSLLARVCLVSSEAQRQYADQLALATSWSHFWSDLLDQDASASAAVLLEPGTKYTLEVKTNWAYLHEDLTIGQTHDMTDTFVFTTVSADNPPAALRGPASALDSSDWEVRTTPLDQASSHYRTRPIRIEFPDARTDKVFAAFGKRLVLRLIDEEGRDLFDQLEVLREHATDLPQYQQAWRDVVTASPCAPAGLETLWSNGAAHFASLLQPGVRYDGALLMLPDSVADLTSVADWTPFPELYHFVFRTSRFETLTDHVGAYQLCHELCEGEPDLGALFTALHSPAGGTKIEDIDVLESALFTHLGLAKRDPPAVPELVQIWGKNATGDYAVVGLLLDGPEPLLQAGVQLRVSSGASNLPAATVTEPTGARILLLPRSDSGIGTILAGTLTLDIEASWLDANGVQTEAVHRNFEIPDLPPSLEADPSP